MRPSLFRRLVPFDHRQKFIAWGTPVLFLLCTVSIIVVNDPSFLRSSSVNHPLSDRQPDSVAPPVEWSNLAWSPSLHPPRGDFPPIFPIRVHGTLSPSVSEVYKTSRNDFIPKWLTLRRAFVSPTGHVIYNSHVYPSNHSQFPEFDHSLLDSIKEENLSFAHIVPVQVPENMHAVDGLLYILPLLLSGPPNADQKPVHVVPRRFVDLARVFSPEFGGNFNWTVLHNIWAIGETVYVPEIPLFEEVSPSLILQMKTGLHESYGQKKVRHSGCLLVPYNDGGFNVQEIVNRARKSAAQIIEQEPFPDPLVTLEAIMGFGCAVGFQNKYLGLAAFMKPGSVVIEVQKPDFISRSVLLAASLGMKVHVFVEKDGGINADEFVEALRD